ncbi:dTDP-4-dehydrorhamnose 3,5-epimerase [Novosphingobium sp. FSY-8]|uniref:dTDP-4-dehydrorhamnose 3,5-epimerase n=1 Tax=Novosphingobium ovatum TaxID=1908523 RepID=A0ABW9XGJ3_9SPHN|nr:dTDP-4-dehydrorhamnose 3,5-epimerase [Novosphingobium ovatum]NBC37678.1 dTDP-4-dehydrorhamnose 3,5-epimerase [Novosphingobium ovatum]
MLFRPLAIPGLIEFTCQRHGDERGYFAEAFRQSVFDQAMEDGANHRFVQDNESFSARVGTIRGLHYQTAPMAQGKLVRCLSGAIMDVAVDIRAGSASYGQWAALVLSAKAGNQLWIPPGFAHGFCTLAPDCRVSYKVTAYYSPEHDKGMRWDDPAIGIAWPAVADPETLSAKDRVQPLLADIAPIFGCAPVIALEGE